MNPDPLDVTFPPIEWSGRLEYDGDMEVWATTIDRSARDRAIWEAGRRSSSKAWLLLALGVGAALGFVAGWAVR